MNILSDFTVDARTLDVETFCKRHGEAFLILEGVVSDLKPPESAWQHTLQGDREMGGSQFGFLETPVYAVRYSGRSSSPQFVTVGRSSTSNDIVVMDESVSGFHAFFERGPDDEFFILDFNSKNGTFVNKVQIASNVPVQITSGDSIRFGFISFIFLRTSEFISFARRACH